jgi:hypothetical protein
MFIAKNLSKRLLGFPSGAYLEVGTEGPIEAADVEHPVVQAWADEEQIEITEVADPPKRGAKAKAEPKAELKAAPAETDPPPPPPEA